MDVDSIFHRTYPRLFRYLHRLTGSPDTADDLAQESFVRLVSRPPPDADVQPWLFRVATNLFLDGARAAGRHRRLLASAPLDPPAPPLPDEAVEHAERVRRVRAALERIPERDRAILLMRAEGFRYEEIAHAVDVAPSSIGPLLARAVRRFVTVYSRPEGGNDDASE
ncbi:MAG TPA: sigma-70 family RNA polymerase sigma factor [Longimicrobiaceae bacterium]|nr:sigma-70 family RNA polymerase sigma factor [Longimicrobiaceae bacterium]